MSVVGETPDVKPHIPRVVVFDELRHLGVLHSRRQVDRLEAAGQFPKRMAMGTGRVGWLATEIIEYIDDRVAERSTAIGTLGSDSTLIAEAAHPQRADVRREGEAQGRSRGRSRSGHFLKTRWPRGRHPGAALVSFFQKPAVRPASRNQERILPHMPSHLTSSRNPLDHLGRVTSANRQPHPLAELFPPMSEADIQELAADIKANGLENAITIFEDAILDGVNRHKAYLIAGVEPTFVPYRGDDVLRRLTCTAVISILANAP